jgi:lysine 2,3-aminomutase
MKNNAAKLSERYAFGITDEMSALMAHDNDPIALQFMPSEKELTVLPQEKYDPIEDYSHSPLKALVHRHANRVLLKPTMVCAVYCRFCFRREMVGPGGDSVMQADVDAALDYIEEHTEIREVILTGGDPLMLSPARLAKLMQRLQGIPHLRWIRLHTRIPVVAPKKVTTEMVEALRGIKPVYMAIHANHSQEFTVESGSALARLAQSGVVLLGQSVMLKGVNDNAETLADLFETMVANRIKPYYLHHPDLTVGTSHFRFPIERGMEIMSELRAREVSGLCVPQYTLDIPNGTGKIPLTSDHVEITGAGRYRVKSPDGAWHDYEDVL